MTPTIADMFRIFGRIGLLSFGGPAAQIALMHRVLVDERRWLTEAQFLNALGFCMLLPGPEATQLATYAGWRLRGTRGGLIAGVLFVLPGAAIVLALAIIYATFGSVPLIAALFLGVKAAVLVVVVEALLRVAKRALNRRLHWALAGLSFIGIFVFSLPFPIIILASALVGLAFATPQTTQEPVQIHVSWPTTLGTIALWLVIWLAPLALLSGLLAEVFWFFTQLAIVTFGGAYAVLAYMAQEAVQGQGWLTAGQMLDGLGLAETTPGPLILVTEFVGYLAGYGAGGIGLGIAAALVTLWATFAPCFLWIFAGAPYIEWIASQRRLSGALSGITAAVVGVILNLSIWFALHVLFADVTRQTIGPLTLWQPTLASADWRVALLAVIAAYLLLWRHQNMVLVLAISALGGLVFGAL